jgi:hypothetical protein
VGPRAGLDAAEREESLFPARNRTRALQPVDCRYTDRAILIFYFFMVYLMRLPDRLQYITSNDRMISE